MPTEQPLSILTATSQRLGGPAPVPPPVVRVVERWTLAVPWPVFPRGHKPPTSN